MGLPIVEHTKPNDMRGYSILAAIVHIFCCETFARQCRLLAVDIEEGNISPYIFDDDCYYDSSCQNAIETPKRYYTRYESVVYDNNEAY